MNALVYSDASIRAILQRVKTIAMVGASSNWNRPSYFVMKYLQGKGYRVIPVNPGTAGQMLLGEKIYARLREIPDKIDMVDVFRASDAVGPIMADAIAIGAGVVWMQLGVRNDAAAAIGLAAGVEVIMDRCPKIEFSRLGGELSWSGVNTGIIRNRPPEPPLARIPRARKPAANQSYGFETLAIHAGAAPDPTTGARTTPIFQTTAYVFQDADHAARTRRTLAPALPASGWTKASGATVGAGGAAALAVNRPAALSFYDCDHGDGRSPGVGRCGWRVRLA